MEGYKIVVLDDDPTGIQTVHGCMLITDWRASNIRQAFDHKSPVFYILTNTRSMNRPEAVDIITEATRLVIEVNKQYNYKLIFISRSDSTLRGHFPDEPEAIIKVLQLSDRSTEYPVFFIPSFFEAGRMTVSGIHYMKQRSKLIPVSETEFAGDSVFGYKNSELSDYIVEKSDGKIKKEEIAHIGLDLLKKDKIDELKAFIKLNKDKRYIYSDSKDYSNLECLSEVLLELSANSDNPIVLRTSSSMPKSIAGIDDAEFIKKEDLKMGKGCGLIIVGSHVKKSTSQLEKLLKNKSITGIEVNVNSIINWPDPYMAEILMRIGFAERKGLTPVIYTSRDELKLPDTDQRLDIGKKISLFLVNIVKHIKYTPTFIIAKGGITSNDIMTKALGIKTAIVAGQVVPGVPVIIASGNERFSGIPYIIFPGNVGNDNTLYDVASSII